MSILQVRTSHYGRDTGFLVLIDVTVDLVSPTQTLADGRLKLLRYNELR